jgi:hypothetical protein
MAKHSIQKPLNEIKEALLLLSKEIRCIKEDLVYIKKVIKIDVQNNMNSEEYWNKVFYIGGK